MDGIWDTAVLPCSSLLLALFLQPAFPCGKRGGHPERKRPACPQRQVAGPCPLAGLSGSQVQKKFWRPFWAGSYLVLCRGISAEAAAGFVSLFFLGITAGRAISGFLTMKLGDTRMIRLGEAVIFLGILCFFLPFGSRAASAGLILTGLGCAPVYPSIIHSTPEHFGADKSQAVIGVQMAFAYVGSLSMPPLFGVIASHAGAALFPVFLIVILALMAVLHEKMLASVRGGKHKK